MLREEHAFLETVVHIKRSWMQDTTGSLLA
jgi:hypothetical protein